MEQKKEPIKILLIDDENSIRNGLGELLRDFGYEVDTASNSKEVYELVRNNDYTIHICDIRMPGEDGITILKNIRELKIDSYFIMITGYGDEQKAIDCLNSGAFAYLKKPVFGEELKIIIERCIMYQNLAIGERMLEGVLLTISNIEHNINNPIAAILGSAEILAMKYKDEQKILKFVNIIIENSQIISNHIKRLREIKEIKIWASPGGKMLDVQRNVSKQ